ncbi:hypothetical protein FSP39_018587 [Pinctada imbricata]|uniref:Ig-like domain-containing protein n=1 Tax=Pinctada imbricata TaxID=66713 RepID=A0AA88XZY9_PINIB|nr:hypothetical protein FSP39_018587 [Pinctada imbricata]
MAQIFQQLANSEIAIFNKYCGKNSTICLPGLKGDSGVAGQKGDLGIPGIMGPKGEPGIIGAPGQKGSKGDIGSSGTPGPSGIKGSKGEMGLPGAIGFPGQKGDRGARGESGPAGVTGIKGNKGDRGDMGLQGIKGEVGLQGPQGNDGAQGVRGEKGQKGDNGEVRDLRPTTPCCDLLERPTFNRTEETIKALEGTKVTLTCNPHGHPTPTITWSPDPSADNSGTVLQVGNDLQLSNLDVSQTGKYVCTAQSALGTTTKTYNLEVYKHIKFVGGMTNHTLLEGQNVVFECRFAGVPVPKVSWFRNNPDGSRTEITTGIVSIPGGSQLELQRVSPVDKGEYTCEADNGLGDAQTTCVPYNSSMYQTCYVLGAKPSSVILSLNNVKWPKSPPTILPQPTVSGLVGQNLTLHCNAQGDPKPTTTWSSPPNVNNAYENKNGDLMLMNVQIGDAGPYVCKATNSLGSTSSTVNLEVKGDFLFVAPGHVEIAGRVNSVTNNTRTVGLDCTATGEQPLTVQWYRNGVPVIPDSNHVILPGNTLLILNVKQPDDLGQYMCVASNMYGSDNKTALSKFCSTSTKDPIRKYE